MVLSADETVLDILANYKDNEFSTLVDLVQKAEMEDAFKEGQHYSFSLDHFKRL